LRIEDEGEGQERAVLLVCELEDVELVGDTSLRVGEERKARAEPGAEGAVALGTVAKL